MFTVTDLANDLARKKMKQAPSAVSVGTNTEQGRSYTDGLTTSIKDAPLTSGATGLQTTKIGQPSLSRDVTTQAVGYGDTGDRVKTGSETQDSSPFVGGINSGMIDRLRSGAGATTSNTVTDVKQAPEYVAPQTTTDPYLGGKGGVKPDTRWDIPIRGVPSLGNQPVEANPDPLGVQEAAAKFSAGGRDDYWDPEARDMMSQWTMTPEELEAYAAERTAGERGVMDQVADRMMSKQLMQMQSAMGARGMGMSGAAGAMSGDILRNAALDRAEREIALRQQARQDALGQQSGMMNLFGQEAGDLYNGRFREEELGIERDRLDIEKQAAENLNALIAANLGWDSGGQAGDAAQKMTTTVSTSPDLSLGSAASRGGLSTADINDFRNFSGSNVETSFNPDQWGDGVSGWDKSSYDQIGYTVVGSDGSYYYMRSPDGQDEVKVPK